MDFFGLVPFTYLLTVPESDIGGFVVLDKCWSNPEMNRFWSKYKYFLYVDVKDFDVPSFEEMDLIIDFIDFIVNKKGKKCIVSCKSNFGRTGVVLAIWCALNGIHDPIRYVREKYSILAIETIEQEKFIEEYLRYRLG